jgi:hypothetical protein
LEEIGLDIVHGLRERAQLVRALEECTQRLDALNAEAQSIFDRPAGTPAQPPWPHEQAMPLNEDAAQTHVLRPPWLARGVPSDHAAVPFDRGVPAPPRVCAWCPDPENWDERCHPNGQHGHIGIGVEGVEKR